MARLARTSDGETLIRILSENLTELDRINRRTDASKHTAGQALAYSEIVDMLATAEITARNRAQGRK